MKKHRKKKNNNNYKIIYNYREKNFFSFIKKESIFLLLVHKENKIPENISFCKHSMKDEI